MCKPWTWCGIKLASGASELSNRGSASIVSGSGEGSRASSGVAHMFTSDSIGVRIATSSGNV